MIASKRNPFRVFYSRGFVLFSCDIVAFIFGFLLSSLTSPIIRQYLIGGEFITIFPEERVIRLIVFLGMMSVALTVLFYRGHYTRRLALWTEVQHLVTTLIVVAVIDGFLNYTFKYQFSRLWLYQGWIYSGVLIIALRRLAYTVAAGFHAWEVPTMVIGNGENALDAIYGLRSESQLGYRIDGMINPDGFSSTRLPEDLDDISVVDGSGNLASIIQDRKDHLFVIAVDDLTAVDMKIIVDNIAAVEGSYAMVPPLKGLSLSGLESQVFFGHDVMFLIPRNNLQNPVSRAIKRSFDLLVSIIMLILTAPLFLIFSLRIMSDGGPVYYPHVRVGRNGRKFSCLKFRTMVEDADTLLDELLAKDETARKEWAKFYKLKDDPRITKAGKFLRQFSLDELPQLINVLKGDMSLVGPRPIIEGELERYRDDVRLYLSVRPGITGLWQISGRSDATYDYRVHLDAWYVRNWALWHDIAILFKTIGVVLRRRGAY